LFPPGEEKADIVAYFWWGIERHALRHSKDSDGARQSVDAGAETLYDAAVLALKIIPIRLDDVVMTTNQAWAADLRRSLQIGDFRDWTVPSNFDRGLQRLLRDLSASV
jgi:hypothetical protein